jgi:hypothetical protein
VCQHLIHVEDFAILRLGTQLADDLQDAFMLLRRVVAIVSQAFKRHAAVAFGEPSSASL